MLETGVLGEWRVLVLFQERGLGIERLSDWKFSIKTYASDGREEIRDESVGLSGHKIKDVDILHDIQYAQIYLSNM